MIFTYSPFHAFTEIVRSSLSCSSLGTLEKKFRTMMDILELMWKNAYPAATVLPSVLLAPF